MRSPEGKHTPPVVCDPYEPVVYDPYMTLMNSTLGLLRVRVAWVPEGCKCRERITRLNDDGLQPTCSLGGCLQKKEYISSRRLHSPGLSRPNLRNLSGISSNLARYSVHPREKINICPFNGRFIKLI